ncbi:MAG TPA: hypothetical protein VL134_13500 [Leptolyngbya sp.]|nr:hypothetical protein [Leptolyngbya sp.]
MIPVEPSIDAANSATGLTYRTQLYPWCVIRFLPNLQRSVIQRFRKRTEAEAYLKVLKRLLPETNHQIVFDPTI